MTEKSKTGGYIGESLDGHVFFFRLTEKGSILSDSCQPCFIEVMQVPDLGGVICDVMEIR